MQMNTQNTNLG